MTRKLVQVAVLVETRELVQQIADATNQKKSYIVDQAIRDYAAKKQITSTTETLSPNTSPTRQDSDPGAGYETPAALPPPER